MNVFIGGSRAVSKLNPAIRERMDDLMNRRCTILIGDANGADKAVQEYLAARQYTKVLIFCMQHCRNNIGHWQTHVYFTPTAEFHVLANESDLQSLLALCRTVDLEIAARGLKLKQPRAQSPLPLVGR